FKPFFFFFLLLEISLSLARVELELAAASPPDEAVPCWISLTWTGGGAAATLVSAFWGGGFNSFGSGALGFNSLGSAAAAGFNSLGSAAVAAVARAKGSA